MARNLLEPKYTYVVEYPEAVAFTDKAMSIYWPPNEIIVSKDVHDILTNLTPSEKHGVITTLKLFTQYEIIVGEEYWGKVSRMFHKPADISRMSNCFSFFEANIHAPFYSNINEALGLATEEFYTEYTQDPVLSARIASLEEYAASEDPAEFLMALSIIEGVVLYSNFAYLKHFQSQGKNKITNIVRGINFSVRDEGLHSLASSWLFKTYLEEQGKTVKDYQHVLDSIVANVRDHEFQIVDMIFSRGEIEGITATQMKNFIDSRINLVANNMGFKAVVPRHTHNPIETWFYTAINSYTFNDFFSGIGREYSRNWDEGNLEW